jgi:hypothetical protein
LLDKINSKFNKILSIERIRIMLHRNKISWKKPDKKDYRRDEEKRNIFLKKFSKKIFSLDMEKTTVWFLDEVFISINPSISYDWGPKGKKIVLETNGSNGKDCIIGAIDPNDGKSFFLQWNWIDSEVVSNFLEELSRSYPNKKHIIILDRKLKY